MLDIESVRNGNCDLKKLELSSYVGRPVKDLLDYLATFEGSPIKISVNGGLCKLANGGVAVNLGCESEIVESANVIGDGYTSPDLISIITTPFELPVHKAMGTIEAIAYYLAKKGASVESSIYLGSNASQIATELYRLGFTSVDDPVVQLVGELWLSDFCMYTSLMYNATNILRIAQEEIAKQITTDDQREVVAIALYIAGKLCTKEVNEGSNFIGHDAVELAIELYKHGYKTIAEPIVSIAAEMYTGSSACLIVQNAAIAHRDIYQAVYSSKTQQLLGF